MSPDRGDGLAYQVAGLDEPPNAWQVACLEALERVGARRTSGGDAHFLLDLGTGGTPPYSRTPPLGVWRFSVAGSDLAGLRRRCGEALAVGGRSLEAALVAWRADDDLTLLRGGRIPLVPYSLAASARDVLAELARWPSYACRAFRRTGELRGPGSSRPDWLPVATPRDGGSVLSAVGLRTRLVWNGLVLVGRVLFRHDHWNVGIVRDPIESFLGDERERHVEWCEPPPRGTFRADPFGIQREGSVLVLYEWMDYADGKGRIVAEELGGGGPSIPEGLMSGEGGHRSYPYLFAHDGQVYCVPEASETGRVTLYRAVHPPGEWEEVATLMDGVSAVDTTIFRHDGLWWMMYTDGREGPHHVLYARHAEHLEGPWRPHAANPVKVDIHTARPAGTPFRVDGRLIRPAQDCGRRYGEAVVLNRVLALTPDRFVEEPVRRVGPFREGPYPDGMHTLSRVGPDLTLVDGNRVRFSPRESLRRCGWLYRRLFRTRLSAAVQ